MGDIAGCGSPLTEWSRIVLRASEGLTNKKIGWELRGIDCDLGKEGMPCSAPRKREPTAAGTNQVEFLSTALLGIESECASSRHLLAISPAIRTRYKPPRPNGKKRRSCSPH